MINREKPTPTRSILQCRIRLPPQRSAAACRRWKGKGISTSRWSCCSRSSRARTTRRRSPAAPRPAGPSGRPCSARGSAPSPASASSRPSTPATTPARLLGVSYASADHGDVDDIVRASWRLRFDTGQLRSFELVSSRGGLLVLWRHEAEAEPELRVCNTFTGNVAWLPYMDEEVGKWGNNHRIYRPALLTVADAGRSFELFAMDGCLRTCIFSCQDGYGKWGAIRLVKLPPEHECWCFVNQSTQTSPAIIGCIVHWICCSTRRAAGVFILAVHADSAQATAIEPPPQGYLSSSSSSSTGSCTLAATPEGNLSMFVPEAEVISMWTLSTEGWSRDAVICKHGIGKQVMPHADANGMICWCVGFGTRSRTVIFWMEKVGLIEINLGTMKANVLPWHGTSKIAAGVCFHEIDMASLL